MATKVLTDKHPFMDKVNKLYDFMEENGIIIIGGAGVLHIIDSENSKNYRLKGKDSSEYIDQFPTLVEFKLTFEEF